MGEVLAHVRGAPSPAWMDQTRAQALADADVLEAVAKGTVYGVVLNTWTERKALAGAFAQPPYKAPPEAPVLYIKTSNTLNRHGGSVVVPTGMEALEVNAALAVVIGRTASRVSEAHAMGHVLGFTIGLDVCEPHQSYYRPAIRQRCQDGFLPIGPWVVATSDFAAPDAADIVVQVNGVEASRWSTADLVRPVARLISDVTAFMPLVEGDVLLTGLAPAPALAGIGDRVSASVAGLGRLDVALIGEAS